MDLRAIAADIPDYIGYRTLDELTESTHNLADEFPTMARVRTVGESSVGDEIECLTIGNGSRSAVVYGVPNSNEPVGTLTIEFLARRLCEDADLRAELDFTWHFVKVADPDGLRLNEGWLRGPISLTGYHRNFFRETMAEEADLNFPIEYQNLVFDRPPPETRALMAVIDGAKPDFCYALHNAEIGGTFYYVNQECESIYGLLGDVPTWFGLHLDTLPGLNPGDVPLAPGINHMTSVKVAYDFLKEMGISDPATSPALAGHGGLISDYLEPYGTFCLIPEVSPFDDPRSCDQSPSGLTRAEVIAQCVDILSQPAALATRLAELDGTLRLDTRVHRAVRHGIEAYAFMSAQQQSALDTMDSAADASNAPEADGDTPATVAEWHRILLFRAVVQRLRGMYVRILDLELEGQSDRGSVNRLAKARDEAVSAFEIEAAALEQIVPPPAPIRSVVGTQVCAGLAAAEYVRTSRHRR